MVTIQWRNAYNTGVDLFDQEHLKIVELINIMFTAIFSKGKKRFSKKFVMISLLIQNTILPMKRRR